MLLHIWNPPPPPSVFRIQNLLYLTSWLMTVLVLMPSRGGFLDQIRRVFSPGARLLASLLHGASNSMLLQTGHLGRRGPQVCSGIGTLWFLGCMTQAVHLWSHAAYTKSFAVSAPGLGGVGVWGAGVGHRSCPSNKHTHSKRHCKLRKIADAVLYRFRLDFK